MKERVIKILGAWKHSIGARVIYRYNRSKGSTWATSVAWNILFSFFPIVLLVLELGTAIFIGQATVSRIDYQVMTTFPGAEGTLLVTTINDFRHPSGFLVLLTILGYLWSGSSLFSSLEGAFAAMNDVTTRGFIASRLRALVLIVVFAILIVAAVATSTLLAVLGRIHHLPVFLYNGLGALALQGIAGVIDFGILATVIYYMVPKRRPIFRHVAITATAVGAGMEILTLCFPLYLNVQHGFALYGKTIALLFLVMTYAYCIGQIVVLGACLLPELSRDPYLGAVHITQEGKKGTNRPLATRASTKTNRIVNAHKKRPKGRGHKQ